MTGLRGEAAIVGIAELPAEKRQSGPPSFTLDQYARLAKMVIEDAGVDPAVVNGLSTHGIAESDMFAPATLSEYLGLPLDFGDRVDLGGATAAGMVWRAAAAVELGLCDAVLAVDARARPRFRGRSRGPDGHSAGTGRRATTTARRRPSSRSRTATSGRTVRTRRSRSAMPPNSATTQPRWRGSRCSSATNACAHPGAVFHGKPITVDDVLDSPVIADPIHMLETVMRVQGGAGVLIANADVARRARHRPVWIKGFGEHIRFKTPTYADDLIRTPIARAAERAFAMAGLQRSDIDMASIYDCYTITVLMTLGGRGILRQGRGHDVADASTT